MMTNNRYIDHMIMNDLIKFYRHFMQLVTFFVHAIFTSLQGRTLFKVRLPGSYVIPTEWDHLTSEVNFSPTCTYNESLCLNIPPV